MFDSGPERYRGSAARRVGVSAAFEMLVGQVVDRERAFRSERQPDLVIAFSEQHRHLDLLHRKREVDDALGVARLEVETIQLLLTQWS